MLQFDKSLIIIATSHLMEVLILTSQLIVQIFIFLYKGVFYIICMK